MQLLKYIHLHHLTEDVTGDSIRSRGHIFLTTLCWMYCVDDSNL